jgi:hypothetical protein
MTELRQGRVIGYWVVTGLFALSQSVLGVLDLVDPLLEQVAVLGYPDYLPTILGPFRIVGVAVLLMPKQPKLKEWAYAGFVFLYAGAAASQALGGGGAASLIAPVVLLAATVGSYHLRPPDRRLP